MSERYDIKRRIGQGGVGAVYEAYDTLLNRSVAIKRLLPDDESEVAEGGIGTDLSKEAAILSSLHHPNIITLYDVAYDEEGAFVVMELIDGETIEEVVQRGAMTEDDFGVMVEQSLEALIAAQEKNLLHRDIKPTNIMVQWLGGGGFQIKVLDFGLAKYSAAPAVQTVDHGGAILGSIYFLAPEQFERIPLDPRTDLYALGCVLYYCLTKRYPFDGDNAPDVMMAHLEHKVEPLAEIRPDLPPALSAWVMRMMSREMDSRPVDASEALREYRAIKANPHLVESDGGKTPPPVLPKVPPPSVAATATAKAEDDKQRKRQLVGATSGRLIMGEAAPDPEQVRRSLTSRAVATTSRGDTTSFQRPAATVNPATSLTSRSVVVAPEAEVRKIPALAIILSTVGLLAIVAVVVALLVNRDRTEPKPPPANPGTGAPTVPMTDDGIPSEGLAAHYTSFRGVLKEGGGEANSGDTVWGWQDQAAFLGGNHLRFQGGEGAKGPKLVKVGGGKSELKGNRPALQFSPGATLAIPAPDALAISKNWEEGITVCLVVKSSDPNNPRVLQISGEKNSTIAAEVAFLGSEYAGGLSLDGAAAGTGRVKVNKNGAAIITLVWDRERTNQRLFSRLPSARRHNDTKIRKGSGPDVFPSWVLGGNGAGEKERYAGEIFELAIYNRALTNNEVGILEDAFANQYFKTP